MSYTVLFTLPRDLPEGAVGLVKPDIILMVRCIAFFIDFFFVCSEYLLIIFKLHVDKNHRTVLSNVYNILLFYFPGNPFQILFLKI